MADERDERPWPPRRREREPGPAVDYELPEALDEETELIAEGPAPPALPPHGDLLAGPAAAGESAEEAFLEAKAPPPKRLFAFYDRLRARVASGVERRAGRLGRPAADALLLVPDVFMLLVRLAFDREVPGPTRSLIAGALAYFVLPFDLLPEGLLGGAGFVDDLVLATAVLAQVLSPELQARAARYWSGRQELRRTLQEVVGAAHSLLGANLFAKLQALLARRGIVLDEQRAGDSGLGA
jgi:uncharacterized membrane protein YkvA (DUF1232 family)